MGKYRQHATTHSVAVTKEIFNEIKEIQSMLQKSNQETITLDDALRYMFHISENKWGSTRFEKE